MNMRSFVVPVLLGLFAGHSRAAEAPRWMEPESGAGEATVRFPVPEAFREASLRVTAEHGGLDVELNGRIVAELEPFDPVLDLDVRLALLPGAENEVRLDFRQGTRAALSITVDGTAVATTGPGWIPAGRVGTTVDPVRWSLDRLPDLGAFEEYNQWKESLPGSGSDPEVSFTGLPAGFAIERIASARPEDGSWISLAFDPQGGVLVSREDAGILRLTGALEPGGPVEVQTVEETLQECRGLLWAHDALYAHANRSGGLYRLRDRDGDGRFEERTLLRETPGRTGHGRNDLALGPDGWIYAICGDDVGFPDGARDESPQEPEGSQPLGHLARTDPDGKVWEVLCRGLRNPYGIDFNRDGEAFTFDADNEGDIGLPFYRPTRVNHLLPGANYGWLQGAGNRSWPVHAADSLPSTLDIGRGSPTAVRFGSRSRFPPPYRDALFVLDWAYGRILAVWLQPRGASYHAAAETFLRGRPLNVTDLEIAPDGSMFLLTGGRKTRSAIYRIRALEPSAAGDAEEDPEDPWADHRTARRELEALRAEGPDDPAVARAWEAVGHPDPWIRHAARVALERWPTVWWSERLDGPGTPLQLLTGGLAMARCGDAAQRVEAARRVSRMRTEPWRRPEKLAALRIWDLATQVAEPSEDVVEAAIRAMRAWEEDVSPAVRWEALALRGRLGDPGGVEASLRFLAVATSQPERLHALEVLCRAKTGWTPETRRAAWTALEHGARFSRGDRNLAAFFGPLREGFLAGVTAEEHPEFFAEPDSGPGGEPPEATPDRAFVAAWKMEDFEAELRDGSEIRNLERGARWFEEAWCSRCHQFGARGEPSGPDLTMVGGRFGAGDLLRAILEPSHVVAEPYRISVVTLRDGTVVMGRVIQDDFRESKVHLSTDAFDLSRQTTLAKGDIAQFEESPVSPMPPGLLDRFTQEEILELLAYLRSGGGGGGG